MADDKSFHMTPDEFRRHGHAVVDWIADYHSRIESFPVLSQMKPGEIRASLPPNPPAHGEPFEALLRDVEKLILPGVTHWQSPNFFAYFPCNASGPGILGDLLSSGLNVQGMLWSTSPACTELETHVLDWLVSMLGLPEKFLSYQYWRRSDSRYCLECRAVRPVGRARARHRLHEQSKRMRRTRRGLCIVADTFFFGKSGDDRGHRPLQCAPDRSGREFAMRPERLPDRLKPTSAPDWFPASFARPWALRLRMQWIRYRRSPISASEHNLWLHVDAAMSGTAAAVPGVSPLAKRSGTGRQLQLQSA